MKKQFSLKRLILGGVILLVVWFGGYEIAEHLWFAKHFKELLPVFHIIKGILAALFIVVLILWYFSRFQFPLYPLDKPSDIFSKNIPTEEDILIYHARWFITTRWFVSVMVGIIVYTTCYLFAFLDKVLFLPLIFCAFLLVLFNILFSYAGKINIPVKKFIIVQVIIDLIILTVLLHFSGGLENPFTFLYIFHVVISGILLDKKTCYWITALACGLFIIMALGEMTQIFEHYTLSIFPHEVEEANGHGIHASYEPLFVFSRIFAQSLTVFLTAYFITEVAVQLKQTRNTALTAAQLLIAENEKLRGVIMATGVGLAVLDRRGKLEWIEPIPEMWKGELEQFLTQTIFSLFKTEFKKQISKKNKEHGKFPHIEKEYYNKEGNRSIYSISLFPLKKEKKKPVSIAALVQDVTEQKDIMTQLIQASKMAAIGELAGNVAHEINNPVGIISSKSRLLLSDFMDKMPGSEMPYWVKVKSEIEKIINLSDRVTHITKGLLRFSRPSIEPKSIIDVNEAISHTLELVEHSLKVNKIEVKKNFSQSSLPAYGNLNELEQVFLNIITNAKDSMEKGGKLSITSNIEKVKKNHDWILVTIHDTGKGIKPQLIDRIFEPFFTTKEITRGTGLGLSICKGIIESYKGSIDVESKINHGTTFIIRVPYHKKGV